MVIAVKKTIFFFILLLLVFYWLADSIAGGKVFQYLESRKDISWAPDAYVYLSDLYVMVNDNIRALEILENFLEHFPEHPLTEKVEYKIITIYEKNNNRVKLFELIPRFISDYPHSYRNEILKKKLNFFRSL